jgi:dihydroxyacetone kinase DhaKLM complex PTS-EIIA-like component DhaM
MKYSTLVATGLLLADTTAARERLSITPNQVGLLARGVLEGALDTEHLDDYVTCTIGDGVKIGGDLELAMAEFKKKTLSGYANGIGDVGDALLELSDAIDLCESTPEKEDLKNLIAMIKSFKNPKTFIYHVGKDLIVNGIDILHQIENATTAFHAAQYEKAGQYLGDALAEALIGSIQEKFSTELRHSKNLDPAWIEAADIIEGVLKGAVQAEGLQNIESCVKDSEEIVGDVYHAVKDFEKKDKKDALAGLKLIA